MNMIDIILGVIAVLGAIATYFFIPLIKIYFVPYLNNKLTKQQLDIITYWIEIAIRYFEVNIDGSDMGDKKKYQVINFLQEKGFTISEDDLDKIIDAMVLEFNKNEWK